MLPMFQYLNNHLLWSPNDVLGICYSSYAQLRLTLICESLGSFFSKPLLKRTEFAS